jgi:hypothetical protein
MNVVQRISSQVFSFAGAKCHSKMKLASPSSPAILDQFASTTSSSRTSRVSSSDIDLLAKYVEEDHEAANTNPERKRNRSKMAPNLEDKEATLKLVLERVQYKLAGSVKTNIQLSERQIKALSHELKNTIDAFKKANTDLILITRRWLSHTVGGTKMLNSKHVLRRYVGIQIFAPRGRRGNWQESALPRRPSSIPTSELCCSS